MTKNPVWLDGAMRIDTAHRTTGPPERPQRWGCGFMLKAAAGKGGYVNRVMREYAVVYVLRGSGHFVDGAGRKHQVAAGDLLHHLPDRPHSLMPDANGQWAEVYIAADGRFAAVATAAGCDATAEPVVPAGIDAGLVERFEYVHRALREADDLTLKRATAWLLDIILLAQGLAKRGRSDPETRLVEQACDVLGEALDKRRSLPRLADEMGVSYERLRKVFAAKMGISPQTYRIRRRIDRARELIEQEGLSNKEAAYRLGYADPFTFSKQFKSVVGVSPAVFRKRMR